MSVEWDGDGLPPVGCICEASITGEWQKVWVRVKIMYISEFTAVMRELEDGSSGEQIHHPRTLEFRPYRTESERRRDAAVVAMSDVVRGADQSISEIQAIYDAIAAGKIPGIRLADE